MLLKILLSLIVFGQLSTPLQAGLFNKITNYFQKTDGTTPPKISVLLVNDKQGVILEVKGKYKIYDPHTGDHLSSRFTGKRKFIQAVSDGLKWGEEFPGIYQILIVPDESNTTVLVDGIEYHGSMYVYDIGGSVSVVNELYIEDFLSSILAQRYKEPYSEEALAAIAIAARTAAYYNNENPKSQYWGVDAKQTEYLGFAAINKNSPMEKAIQSTRYMILSNAQSASSDPIPFIALWSQDRTNKVNQQGTISQITLTQVEEMAKKGDHAAKILLKAFPGTKLELMHFVNEK